LIAAIVAPVVVAVVAPPPSPVVLVVPPQAAPPQADPAPPTAPDSAAPELADPMADPATAPVTVAGTPTTHHAPGDPLEGLNRGLFGVHQGLDKAIYRPVAMGYKAVVPRPARSGLRNVLTNLTEPVVFLNYVLQLKFESAFRTFARFAVNSTLGVGGLLDVAASKGFRTPHENNSFGNTLARYGVGPGPYLFLPLVGPTTLRDVLGGPVDGLVLPLAIGTPFDDWRYQVTTGALRGIDLRAESDGELRALFAGAVDPYATLRSVWLQNRAGEVEAIRHPKKAHATAATPELADPLADPGGATPPSDAPELRDSLADPAAAPN
jgi:phospholipid-binding lipoprotein MlaA